MFEIPLHHEDACLDAVPFFADSPVLINGWYRYFL
jgi:hypothetical protein